MKKLAIIAFAALATSAFATETCTECPQIDIKGTSTQTVTTFFSNFQNEAKNGSGAYAQQNVSSNSGNVEVAGTSEQSTHASWASVTNTADGADAYASQNLASNLGNVKIYNGATSTQTVSLVGGSVINKAAGNTKAIQNLASNNGCSTCQPDKKISFPW